MKIDLSIVIPALREEKIIGDTLQKVAGYLKTQKFGEVEVVVVAAHAGDKTEAIAKKHAHLFAHYQVINSGPRVGKGHDVQTGMLAAKGEKRIFMDADLATPLHHIAPLVQALDSHDIAIGIRRLNAIHKGIFRSFVSQAGNMLIRTQLLPGIPDSQCGFKGFTALAAEQLFSALQTKGWGFDMEILARARQAKLTIKQIPIADWHEAREQGLASDSKTSVALQSLQELARIKWLLLLDHWPAIARLWWIPPLLAFGLAGILYMQKIGEWSIWFDEAFSVALIQFDPAQLISLTAADVHPPLYYLALQAWASVFGESEAALRSLSAFCMIVAMGVGFLLVRRCFGVRAAYLTLPFLLAAPFLLRYGQEARMYAMATLICVLATYFFVLAQAKGEKLKTLWWILYIVTVIAGLYTHYYTGLIWIVHWVWHWYMTRQTGEKFWSKTWLIVYGAIFVGFAPWLYTFIKQFLGVQAGFWIGPVSHQTLLNIASTVLGYHQQWEFSQWTSVMFMAAIAGLALLFCRAYKATEGATRHYFVLFMLYSFVPIAVLFVLSLPPLRSILVERYFVPAMLVFYLTIGVALALAPRAKHWFESKILISVTVLALMIWGATHVLTIGNFVHNQGLLPQAKPLMTQLQGRVTGNTALVVNSPYAFYEFEYYKLATHPVYFVDQDKIVGVIGSTAMEVGSPYLVPNLEAFGKTKDSVWILGIGDSPGIQIPQGWQENQQINAGTYFAVEFLPPKAGRNKP
ncbi:MAG TPA: glycosyltransferase family 39 protein [Candidatus Saccharimonadales bacterium]|nr:glycosyltransferase family 39 protein [Candidatus Saccharimonadales bacterium]